MIKKAALFLVAFVVLVSVGSPWGRCQQGGSQLPSHFFPIVKDRKYGYIDTRGQMVIEPQFDEAGDFSQGLARVRMGDKVGYINTRGIFAVEGKLDGIPRFSEGLARVLIGGNAGKYGFLDKTGTVVIPPRFVLAGDFSEGRARVWISDAAENGSWGYIDQTGAVVIDCRFDLAGDFSEGLARVQVRGTWGYIDKTGAMAIGPHFENSGDFSEGLARVQRDGKWGYIDPTGTIVIEPRFDGTLDFSDGLAVTLLSGRWGYIDKTGKAVIEPKFAGWVKNFSGGAAMAWLDGKAGFINRTGKIIEPLPPFEDVIFSPLGSFSEGLGPVFVTDKAKRIIGTGFIDATGKFIIKPQLDSVISGFSEGLALVTAHGKEGYIDKTGAFLIEGEHFASEESSRFSEGVVPILGGVQQYGYMDKTSKIVIELQFGSLEPFSEGLVPVWVKGKRGYMDQTGKFAIEPKLSGGSSAFSDGLAFVGFDGVKWGYIDHTGKTVVSSEFLSVYAGNFGQGLTPVRIAGKEGKNRWGYMNKQGKLVIQPQFEWAWDFSQGPARVRVGGKYSYIDTKGKFITESLFDMAWDFSEGLGLVQIGEKFNYVDEAGHLISPTPFDGADSFSHGLGRVSVDGNMGFLFGTATRFVCRIGYIGKTGKYVWEPTH